MTGLIGEARDGYTCGGNGPPHLWAAARLAGAKAVYTTDPTPSSPTHFVLAGNSYPLNQAAASRRRLTSVPYASADAPILFAGMTNGEDFNEVLR